MKYSYVPGGFAILLCVVADEWHAVLSGFMFISMNSLSISKMSADKIKNCQLIGFVFICRRRVR